MVLRNRLSAALRDRRIRYKRSKISNRRNHCVINCTFLSS